jgi:hypothetical protein
MSAFTFSVSQEKEAEFWAWLTDGHVVTEPTVSQSSDKPAQGFRVVSTEEIKVLITDALDKGNEAKVNQLLEIASQPQPLSSELIRKSLRVGNGEYLKLLYVKLLENTSFSDVIIRMLTPYAINYLSAFKCEHEPELGKENQRLNHLMSLIKSWQTISPESRSRAVDMGLVEFEGTNELLADFPHKLEDVKTSISQVIIGELERELFGSFPEDKNRVYEEFKREWSQEITEDPLTGMTLEASIDQGDTNKVLFTPKIVLFRRLTVEEQESLFDKFGELAVLDFVRNFMEKNKGKEEGNYLGARQDGKLQEICLHREVSLPTCSACICDANNFEVKDIASAIMLKRIEQDAITLRTLSETLGKQVGINIDNFFADEFKIMHALHKEQEYEACIILARSGTLTSFLKLATKLAKTAKDFSLIGMINSYRNRIVDYEKAQSFVCDLVDFSIRRRSVVSFYVNKDVWRFLSMAMRVKNWITIVNAYLELRTKQTRT